MDGERRGRGADGGEQGNHDYRHDQCRRHCYCDIANKLILLGLPEKTQESESK